MSLLFSRQCEYALQGILYLALKQNGEMTSVARLSRILKVPAPYLGKILQDLARRGILRSNQGPAGGFALAVSADKINLAQIIEAIDGKDSLQGCMLGFPNCSNDEPCAAHAQWSRSRKSILALLQHKTLDELARASRKTHLGDL